MRVETIDAFLNADATLASVTSAPVDSLYFVNVTVIGIPTGGVTITGTLKLQASNDPVPTSAQIVNWVDVPSATVAVTTSGTNVVFEKSNISYLWMRVVYTKTTSATGALITAALNGSGPG